MKIWKLIFAVPLLFVDVFAHAGTPLYSTRVDRMLDSMLNSTGKFTSLKFADGTTQTTAGGSGNVSYPINLAGGTSTTGILPQTQGGWGTDTTGTIGVVAGKIGIGTTTPTTTLQVIGTVTATGFSGNGAGLTDLVKQVSGTSTGMTADNIAIVGTNSTGTFKNLTVTGTLESGSQWDTGGTWTTTVGVGQSARIVSKGNGSNTISLECDGTINVIGSNTVPINLVHMPQIWAKGSTTVGVTSSITGTTLGTFTSFTIPANSLGNVGWLDIMQYCYVGTTTGLTARYKIDVWDGIATSTMYNQSGVQNFNLWAQLKNTGSTSTNFSPGLTYTSSFANGNISPNIFTINTGNTCTVYLSAAASVSTGTVNFVHAIVKAHYVD